MAAKFISKKNIKRLRGIPDVFPMQCYFPVVGDIPKDSPKIMIGMDSGITNTAFTYIELIQDAKTKSVIDFKLGDTYYFKDELDSLALQKISKSFYANSILTYSLVRMW